MTKRLLIFLLATLALVSCIRDHGDTAFLADSQIRLEANGTACLEYDHLTCQLSFNRELKEFRVGTDSMSDYFAVTFRDIPSHLNQEVEADVCWTTIRTVQRKKNVTLKVMKIEDDKVWLWSNSARMGICMRIID